LKEVVREENDERPEVLIFQHHLHQTSPYADKQMF